MLACMHGQVRQNSQLNKTMQQKYGVSLEEPAELFGVWLGDELHENRSTLTRQILETVGDHAIHYKSCILESDSWQLLTMVIYQVKDGASQKRAI